MGMKAVPIIGHKGQLIIGPKPLPSERSEPNLSE